MPSQLVVRRKPRTARGSWFLFLSFLAGLLLLLGGLGFWLAYETVPSVRYHAQTWFGQVHDLIAPHADTLPTPIALAGTTPLVTLAPPPTVTATPSPTLWPPTATAAPGISPQPSPTLTLIPTETPVPPTPTALAAKMLLTDVPHVYQKFNNCGPASLTEELNYWGWKGTQTDAAQVLKPNQDDKNVSPRELYEFLLTQGFDAYIRMGGTQDLLKRLIAAGYPPIVEKGFDVPDKGWMGHYGVVSGYDDQRGLFIIQDTYLGPGTQMKYADFERNWRAFNFIFLVVFPAGAQHDAKVVSLLGDLADLDHSYRVALDRAQSETPKLSGQDAAFAWFNVGTSLTYLQDYAGAATAYDQARKIGLPYRMLWYQFGPYRSYYLVGRYQDILDLATFAIKSANIPAIEESYYWRGMAEQALGQRAEAVADYQEALKQHPGYKLAADALTALGVTP